MPEIVEKEIVCLANSRKMSGRCVAGREIISGKPGPWIRVVSEREDAEIYPHEMRYPEGGMPLPMDIVRVPLLKNSPCSYQVENWLIAPGHPWHKKGALDWMGLQPFIQSPGPVWLTRSYREDTSKIRIQQVKHSPSSLCLIKVYNLRISVVVENNGRCRLLGRFEYCNTSFALWITDPVFESKYLSKPNKDYDLGVCCLTISIGLPYRWGYIYKLIAAIIPKDDRVKELN
ncbi:MAG: hypothetical protein NZM04_02465 [Methylacidiphilales bacterium]|nr:hypothetical protein [Candidatus Methylacidiphilales bacterium]